MNLSKVIYLALFLTIRPAEPSHLYRVKNDPRDPRERILSHGLIRSLRDEEQPQERNEAIDDQDFNTDLVTAQPFF